MALTRSISSGRDRMAVRSASMADLVTPDRGVRLRGLRREEYERLVETGALEGEHVELLGGEIVQMSPQGREHEWVIAELTRQLAGLMSDGYDVRIQLSLRVDDVSLPEPDVAVTEHIARGDRPSTALLVVEVAVSSLRMDLVHKAPRYAVAGVPTYVVLDVSGRRAVVHTDPTPEGYGSVAELGSDDELDVVGVALDLGRLLG